MGEAPPLTVGTPYSTAMGEACAEVSEMDAGQVMLGGATGGGVGVVGVVGDLHLLLPVSSSTPSKRARARLRHGPAGGAAWPCG